MTETQIAESCSYVPLRTFATRYVTLCMQLSTEGPCEHRPLRFCSRQAAPEVQIPTQIVWFDQQIHHLARPLFSRLPRWESIAQQPVVQRPELKTGVGLGKCFGTIFFLSVATDSISRLHWTQRVHQVCGHRF